MKMLHVTAFATGALIAACINDPAFAQTVSGGTVQGWATDIATSFVRVCQLVVGAIAGYKGYEVAQHSHSFVSTLVPLGAGAATVLLVPPMFGINAIPGLGTF